MTEIVKCHKCIFAEWIASVFKACMKFHCNLSQMMVTISSYYRWNGGEDSKKFEPKVFFIVGFLMKKPKKFILLALFY